MKDKSSIYYFAVLGLLVIAYSILVPQSLYFTVPLTSLVALVAFKFRPTKLSVYAGLFLAILGFLVTQVNNTTMIWWLFLGLWVLASSVDLLFLATRVRFSVERSLPGRFAQGEDGEVTLKIKNDRGTGYNVRVFDGLPQDALCEQMPWNGFIPGERFVEITYLVQIQQRGWTEFGEIYVEVAAPLRLWTRVVRSGDHEKVRVYPNYEPVLQLAIMSLESNPEQMGIVKKNRAGISKEFHQLRDYHEGDMLSQIDWKASSKHQSLISRSYHEQRDQNLVLAIDCGRRMRAHDGSISQFDHCLNAMLLLAYVALKQGDNVGIMAYGGREHWLPPVKGVSSMTTILNHLFEYQTSSSPSDYGEAVERVLMKQKRRSMVVFISNFRGEDASEMVEPLRKLRQRHIVCIGNIREREVAEAMDEDVHSFDDAVRLTSIQRYIESRELVMQQLKSMNIPSVDVTSEKLPVALANQYLAIREMV